ncbi:MAG: hypothetical protein IRZ15_09080 [Bryobacteraceae bacterium]|nr:hypothetical protein [Bryobacteraceae bacterium]
MSVRLNINLASEPFRRDRPILVGATALSILLTASLAVLIILVFAERREVAETREGIARLQRELLTLNSEQAKIDAVLRQPKNAEVLERSVFLNTLLQRKGVSWTKIFSDLESVMPYSVRLIQVRLSPQNETLDMVVGAETIEPVLEFLMKLEKSPLFGPVTIHNWVPPSQTEPLYRYRVSVRYVQKL